MQKTCFASKFDFGTFLPSGLYVARSKVRTCRHHVQLKNYSRRWERIDVSLKFKVKSEPRNYLSYVSKIKEFFYLSYALLHLDLTAKPFSSNNFSFLILILINTINQIVFSKLARTLYSKDKNKKKENKNKLNIFIINFHINISRLIILSFCFIYFFLKTYNLFFLF